LVLRGSSNEFAVFRAISRDLRKLSKLSLVGQKNATHMTLLLALIAGLVLV